MRIEIKIKLNDDNYSSSEFTGTWDQCARFCIRMIESHNKGQVEKGEKPIDSINTIIHKNVHPHMFMGGNLVQCEVCGLPHSHNIHF